MRQENKLYFDFFHGMQAPTMTDKSNYSVFFQNDSINPWLVSTW